jgi:hypothetical protein
MDSKIRQFIVEEFAPDIDPSELHSSRAGSSTASGC